MMRPLPAVIVVLAALAGCANGPTVPSDATKVAFQVVPEATVRVSGFREAAQFVVRPTGMGAVLGQVHGGPTPNDVSGSHDADLRF